MNCYEFNAIDGMSISMEVSGTTYIVNEDGDFVQVPVSGTQTHLSKRPSKICMKCAASVPYIASEYPHFPIRLCSELDMRDLALRYNSDCDNRFRLRKAPDANQSTIQPEGAVNPWVFRWRVFSPPGEPGFLEVPFLKPWDAGDPFYQRNLTRYEAQMAAADSDPYAFAATLSAGNYDIRFNRFEDGAVGELIGRFTTGTVQLSLGFL